VHCCTSHLCSQETPGAAFNSTGQLTHTHPQEQTHPQNSSTLQGAPPSWCGRRVAVSCVRAGAIKRTRQDGQAACEPGGGGCGGVPVHPARLHTHRTSPAQALLTMLTETCCTQRLTCSRTATVVCMVSGVD
jgi:hypothetical protein